MRAGVVKASLAGRVPANLRPACHLPGAAPLPRAEQFSVVSLDRTGHEADERPHPNGLHSFAKGEPSNGRKARLGHSGGKNPAIANPDAGGHGSGGDRSKTGLEDDDAG